MPNVHPHKRRAQPSRRPEQPPCRGPSSNQDTAPLTHPSQAETGPGRQRQRPDSPATGIRATVALMDVNHPRVSKRKRTLFTVVNLATLGFIIAWLVFDW